MEFSECCALFLLLFLMHDLAYAFSGCGHSRPLGEFVVEAFPFLPISDASKPMGVFDRI